MFSKGLRLMTRRHWRRIYCPCRPEDAARHPEDARQLREERHLHPPQTLEFGRMMALVRRCSAFDDGRPASNSTRDARRRDSFSPLALLRGILPGTKWCGVNDAARHYEELGPLRELDRCCRQHDHCPVRINGLESRFGIKNPLLNTVSHCECDKEFHSCLRKHLSPEANLVGMIYFHTVSARCIGSKKLNKCKEKEITCTQENMDANQTENAYFLVDGRKSW